ncbi:MAG: hypothetical protein AAF065_13775 [Verrucomicrobiota bacterium]
MKPSLFKSIFCIGASFIAASCLTAQVLDLPQLPEGVPASKDFSLDEPVRLIDANKKTLFLKGMRNGNLVLSLPNMPGAEAEMPIDSINTTLTLELPKNFNSMTSKAEEGNYGPLYRGMKNTAGALLRFLEIHPSKSNFHSLSERYYKAVVRNAPLKRALEISLEMPWASLSGEYILQAEYLVSRCITEENFKVLEKLLSQLYMTLDEDAFAEMAFRIADSLRTKGQDQLTAKIYGSLAQSSNNILRQKSLLWACYSSAVSGDSENARALFENIEELDREDENFLTYCLARGRVGFSEGDIREGLRFLSRAMVLTTVEATFKAELYYLLIRGYTETGDDTAAQRLVREFEIFYPNSPWLEKYQTESGV